MRFPVCSAVFVELFLVWLTNVSYLKMQRNAENVCRNGFWLVVVVSLNYKVYYFSEWSPRNYLSHMN